MKERWKDRERLVDRKREGGVEENKEKNLDYYKKKLLLCSTYGQADKISSKTLFSIQYIY